MLLNSATDLSPPAQDSVANIDIREVVGNKTDAAQTVVGVTRSLVAYCKGALNQLATLLGYHGVPGADVVTNAQMRDVVGNKTDAAQQGVGATMSLMRYLKGLITALGNPTGDTLTTITAKLGDSASAIGPQVALQTGNEYAGTYSLPSGVAEQTAFDFNTQFAGLAGRRIKAIAIFLDLVNLTQSCTVRVKVTIDGATLRTISALSWTIAMDDGVYFDLESCNINFSVTMQSAIAEGVARDVPVRVVFEQMEQ